jgi:hypothetical protein
MVWQKQLIRSSPTTEHLFPTLSASASSIGPGNSSRIDFNSALYPHLNEKARR